MVDDTLYGRRDPGGNLTTKSAGADSPPIYTAYIWTTWAKLENDICQELTGTQKTPYLPWQQYILNQNTINSESSKLSTDST